MIKKIRAFCCVSGGKDSILSLYKTRKSGVNVSRLVNMISEDGTHSRSHGINSSCLRVQAAAIEIPITQRSTSWENYEDEFKKLVLELRAEGINTGVFGDIDVQEHMDWITRVCGELKIKALLPLWGIKRQNVMREFISAGFKAVVCSVKDGVMGKEWLGRKIDNEFVSELGASPEIDLCGENGEYHTFVYDGPGFKKKVNIKKGEVFSRGGRWVLEIIPG